MHKFVLDHRKGTFSGQDWFWILLLEEENEHENEHELEEDLVVQIPFIFTLQEERHTVDAFVSSGTSVLPCQSL